MKIEDIKKAMEHEENLLSIPISITELKSSKTSISKLKLWLSSEVLCMVMIVLVLILMPVFRELHHSALVLYIYTSFIAVLAILGVVVFQIRLLLSLKPSDLSTKRTIERQLIKIKTNIEVSKYTGTGMFASIFIPMYISNVGRKTNSESFVLEQLYLNLDNWQIINAGTAVIFISVLIFMASAWMYKVKHVKEIKALEKILDQF